MWLGGLQTWSERLGEDKNRPTGVLTPDSQILSLVTTPTALTQLLLILFMRNIHKGWGGMI